MRPGSTPLPSSRPRRRWYDYTASKVLTFNVARMIYTRDRCESDVILGWHPIFVTIADPSSRGLVFFR